MTKLLQRQQTGSQIGRAALPDHPAVSQKLPPHRGGNAKTH